MLYRKRSLILAIVTAFISSGCASTPTEQAPTPTEKVPEWIACNNKEAGYTVTYPPDWKTNQGNVLQPCSLFDPFDVTVFPGTEIPFDIAVTILKQDVSFDDAIEGYGSVKVLEWETLHIGSNRAVRMEFADEEPQSGLSTQLSYQYLIDFGGKTLEVSTHAIGEPAYSHKKRVLDRIIQKLRIYD